jgi:hypothetical protein
VVTANRRGGDLCQVMAAILLAQESLEGNCRNGTMPNPLQQVFGKRKPCGFEGDTQRLPFLLEDRGRLPYVMRSRQEATPLPRVLFGQDEST